MAFDDIVPVRLIGRPADVFIRPHLNAVQSPEQPSAGRRHDKCQYGHGVEHLVVPPSKRFVLRPPDQLAASMPIRLSVLFHRVKQAFRRRPVRVRIFVLKPPLPHAGELSGLLHLEQEIIDEPLKPKAGLSHHHRKEFPRQQERPVIVEQERLPIASTVRCDILQDRQLAEYDIGRGILRIERSRESLAGHEADSPEIGLRVHIG